MEDFTLSLITGIDIPIPDCQLILHQPTIKELSYIGEKEFYQSVNLLCIRKNASQVELQDFSDFQIFLTVLNESKEIKKDILEVLSLFFPKYKVIFTPRALLFNLEKDSSIIDENNFSSFQEILRKVCCLNAGRDESFNPANAIAAEIARKLERGRQRVAAQKQHSEDVGSSVFSRYLSILSIALNTPINNLVDLTIFQIQDLIDRYALWTD